MSNHKKKILVFIALVLIVVSIAITSPVIRNQLRNEFRIIKMLVSTMPDDGFDLKLNDLVSRYKNGELSVINLSSITPVAWDRVYFFRPYTTTEDVDAIVGNSWIDDDYCFEKVHLVINDGTDLLIFTNKNVVVYCVFRPYAKFSFIVPDQAYGKLGLSPQETLFIVNKVNKNDYLVLKDAK